MEIPVQQVASLLKSRRKDLKIKQEDLSNHRSCLTDHSGFRKGIRKSVATYPGKSHAGFRDSTYFQTSQMNRTLYNTPRCPGSLKDGFNSYNPGTLRTLFDSRKVFHVIEGNSDTVSWQKARIDGEQFGGQQWYRVALNKNKPEPHPAGNYILKLVPDETDGVKFPFEQAGIFVAACKAGLWN